MTENELKRIKDLRDEYIEAWKEIGNPRQKCPKQYDYYLKNENDPAIKFAYLMGKFATFSCVASRLDHLYEQLTKENNDPCTQGDNENADAGN